MKILIIRFSSFGDVLQSLSVAGALKGRFPQSEIHWLTREDFAPLVETHPAVANVWTVGRGQSFLNLMALAWRLRRAGFTHVYDAHNNLRSHVIGWIMKGFLDWRRWTGQVRFLRRPIYRFRRFLLFTFRKNFFPKPFSGQGALLNPLKKWDVVPGLPPQPQLFVSPAIWEKVAKNYHLLGKPFVTLAPSAAFPLKRWPEAHWKKLVQSFADIRFVLLGGTEDKFLADIAAIDSNRILNLAGQLSLVESSAVVAHSEALVANDTGLMHVAEQTGRPCVALMGPAPFGFPSRPTTKIMELDLACRPCSKHGQGPCTNPTFQKCLQDIHPEMVARELQRMLSPGFVRDPIHTGLELEKQ